MTTGPATTLQRTRLSRALRLGPGWSRALHLGPGGADFLLALGLFGALTVLVFIPAIARPSLFQVFGGDVYHNLWIWGRNVSNVLAGAAPYAPNIFHPDPLSSFYSEMEVGHSIIYAALSAVGMHPVRSYLVIVLLSFALTGVGVFMIARRLDASTAGAFVGGAIAAFASYRFSQLPHVQLLAVYWMLLPLYFSLSFLMTGHRRDLIAAGIAHFPVLCGPSYNLVGLIVCEASLVVCFAIDGAVAPRVRGQRLGRLGLAGVLALLPTLPIWYGYGQLFFSGFRREPVALAGYSLDLSSLTQPLPGSLLWGPSIKLAPAALGEPVISVFVGVAALILLIGGARAALRLTKDAAAGVRMNVFRFRRALAVAALILLGLALGPVVTWQKSYVLPNPVFAIGNALQLLSATRYIAHFGYIAVAILAVLAGWWTGKATRQLVPGARFAVHGVLFAVVVAENLVAYSGNPRGLPEKLLETPAVYRFLAGLPPGRGVAFLPLPEPRTMGDSVISRTQFEYMLFAEKHRLSMLNGVSGFFPTHFLNGLWRLKDFPTLSGLKYLESSNIEYVVHQRHATPPLDFSAARLVQICGSLTAVYADAEFEVFRVDLDAARRCLAARLVEANRWTFPASSETARRIGRYDAAVRALTANVGETGHLSFGPYVTLEGGKYRAAFTLKTSDGPTGMDLGTVDVFGSAGARDHLYASARIEPGGSEQTIRLDFEVRDPGLRHEFRVWASGKGVLSLREIVVERQPN